MGNASNLILIRLLKACNISLLPPQDKKLTSISYISTQKMPSSTLLQEDWVCCAMEENVLLPILHQSSLPGWKGHQGTSQTAGSREPEPLSQLTSVMLCTETSGLPHSDTCTDKHTPSISHIYTSKNKFWWRFNQLRLNQTQLPIFPLEILTGQSYQQKIRKTTGSLPSTLPGLTQGCCQVCWWQRPEILWNRSPGL